MCSCAGRYDDLSNYSNERSIYLAELREMIEEAWHMWELKQHVDVDAMRALKPEEVRNQCNCSTWTL